MCPAMDPREKSSHVPLLCRFMARREAASCEQKSCGGGKGIFSSLSCVLLARRAALRGALAFISDPCSPYVIRYRPWECHISIPAPCWIPATFRCLLGAAAGKPAGPGKALSDLTRAENNLEGRVAAPHSQHLTLSKVNECHEGTSLI